MDISSPDSQLIERSLAGESGAFTDLCERHRERIWRIVASVASGPDADDLVQEAVIRAYLSLKSYRRTAPFAAWLSKIALNAAHDYQRSAWKRRVLLLERPPEEEAAECPSAEVQRRETLRRVRDAVSRLPRNMGTPIWLHYFEEFSIAEIAELERTSESTVRARIKSGLSRLLVVLQEHVGVVSDPVRRALETKECKI